MPRIPEPKSDPLPKRHYVIREYDEDGFLLQVVEFTVEHPVEFSYEVLHEPYDWQPYTWQDRWMYAPRTLRFAARPDKITLTSCTCGTEKFKECLLHEHKQRKDGL